MRFRVADPRAMHAVGLSLGSRIAPGDVVMLSGSLGTGKTTLARGVLDAMGHKGEVPSPTFAIAQYYEAPPLTLPLVHTDLYRLENANELDELGLDEWLAEGAMLVEWPELLPERMTTNALRIDIAFNDEGGRWLTAHAGPSWRTRWPQVAHQL